MFKVIVDKVEVLYLFLLIICLVLQEGLPPDLVF